MVKPTYWLDLFTGKTWKEFLNAGATVSGFRESRWATVKRIKSGDYLLCYLTGVSRFIGVLEVTSEPIRIERPSGKTMCSHVVSKLTLQRHLHEHAL